MGEIKKINKTEDENYDDTLHLDENLKKKILEKMPDEEKLIDLAEFFKVFGDSTRVSIIYCIHDKEICVQDIADILGMTQSAISHQLRILRDSRLVKSRKQGKQVFYSLDDDHIKYILTLGLDHILEN